MPLPESKLGGIGPPSFSSNDKHRSLDFLTPFPFRAADAAFVRRLEPFRKATEAHMSYLVERLSELSPPLASSCGNLPMQRHMN